MRYKTVNIILQNYRNDKNNSYTNDKNKKN